jgi:hypothetical protein
MTAPADQFADLATRTNEMATAAVRGWVDAVQKVTPALPDAHTVVERYFEVAQQVLDTQRSVVTGILAAGTRS